jgi:hypothetical protein
MLLKDLPDEVRFYLNREFALPLKDVYIDYAILGRHTPQADEREIYQQARAALKGRWVNIPALG